MILKYYILGIFSGLHHLHQKGIVHSCLHEGNILLGTDDQIRLIDFSQSHYSNRGYATDVINAFNIARKILSHAGKNEQADTLKYQLDDLVVHNKAFDLNQPTEREKLYHKVRTLLSLDTAESDTVNSTQ